MFSTAAGEPSVRASVIPAGSWSRKSQSWLWSWDNASIPPDVSAPARAVKAFGERNAIGPLTGAFSPCSEELAWAVAALALKILDAACLYRVPQSNTDLFVLLNDIGPAPREA